MQMINRLLKPIAARWPFPVRATLKNGRQMYVDLRSKIGQRIYVAGEFDPAVFPPLAGRLTAGATFIDIGANVGYYSMRALDIAGLTGHVHAFEIDPRPLACLRKTKKSFHLENFFIYEVALGASSGEVHLTRENDCGNSHVCATGPGVSVPMTSLDEWRTTTLLQRVDAIKLDVEGFELEVLSGGLQLIRQFMPLMVIEADDEMLARNGANVSMIKALLSGCGYSFANLENCWSPTLVAIPGF